jgi:hypothetical protein
LNNQTQATPESPAPSTAYQSRMKLAVPKSKGRSVCMKRVKFSESSTLVITRPKTNQELKACWYAKADTRRFKQQSIDYAKSLIQAYPSEATSYVRKSINANQIHGRFHGVEHMCGIEHTLSPQVLDMLLATKKATIEGVLKEQERQKRTGMRDVNSMANVSIEKSLFSRAWRHYIAVLNSE